MQKVSREAPRELIVVHRLDKKTPLGREGIPLHLTVLPWFRNEALLAELLAGFSDLARKFKPIKTLATHEDLFGPENDIPVMRLEKTRELFSLHLATVSLAEMLGSKFETPTVIGEGWNPHVTHKSNKRLHTGDEVLVTDLDLIAKTGSDNRTLLGNFKLGR